MIELDKTDENYVRNFDRLKNPPTHAYMVALRWAMPLDSMCHGDAGFNLMLRPHVEAVYVYGRLDAEGNFMQTPDDGQINPVHAGCDMSEYQTEPFVNTKGEIMDDEDALAVREGWKRKVAIREALLAHHEAPSKEDPTVRVQCATPKNRFTEESVDIVFSHTDPRIRGRLSK